jgi:hypothetical protein
MLCHDGCFSQIMGTIFLVAFIYRNVAVTKSFIKTEAIQMPFLGALLKTQNAFCFPLLALD